MTNIVGILLVISVAILTVVVIIDFFAVRRYNRKEC